MTTVRWIASSEASALHAAAALAEGREIVDARLAAALAEPVAALEAALRQAGVPLAAFLQNAIPLAGQIDEPDWDELTRLSLQNATGRQFSRRDCAPLATALENTFAAQLRAVPDVARQLELRGALLAEQWDARGPGLLAAILLNTDRWFLPEQADVILVYPAIGGGGAASAAYNLVRIEAVLANPHAEIPEVVRLGWLISQLKPETSEVLRELPPERLAWLVSMAMVPASLHAAAHVELVRFDRQTIRLALDAWTSANDRNADLAETLFAWWESWEYDTWINGFYINPDDWTDWNSKLKQLYGALDRPKK